jgi:TRAP-type C4-dicarboxylate transport system substrate-binding protein
MKIQFNMLAAAAAMVAISTSAFAQTKWDLPAAYSATNFHSENLAQFASDVDKATAGKLKITVHANASLFKANEIKRAVQGGQAQAGEILLANFANEWPIYAADGIPFLADSYDEAMKLYKAQKPLLDKNWPAKAWPCCMPCHGRLRAFTSKSQSVQPQT